MVSNQVLRFNMARIKIGYLTGSLDPSTFHPVMTEAFRIMYAHGIHVTPIVPNAQAIQLFELKIDYDLYILKPTTELMLSFAGILHDRGARLMNSFTACSLVRDKCRVTAKLIEAGLPTPRSFIASNPERVCEETAISDLIVKPHRGHHGCGIKIVRQGQHADTTTENLEFMQEYLAGDGEDLKVFVIGSEVFAVKRIFSSTNGQQEKLKLSRQVEVSETVRNIALKCGKLFGLKIYGIDIIETVAGPFIVDVNFWAGFIGVRGAAEILADYIIRTATSEMDFKHEQASFVAQSAYSQ